jgi:hypothetical protein
MTTYEIYGKFESDKLPSLIISKVNGDPVWTLAQAHALIKSWNIRVSQGRQGKVTDWEIKRITTKQRN